MGPVFMGLILDLVIQPIGLLEFLDGLKMGLSSRSQGTNPIVNTRALICRGLILGFIHYQTELQIAKFHATKSAALKSSCCFLHSYEGVQLNKKTNKNKWVQCTSQLLHTFCKVAIYKHYRTIGPSS